MALHTVANGAFSDASDINQFVTLFKGGMIFDAVNGYGADPSGTTDSYNAIQNAINATGANGGIVFLAPGVYLINHFINLKNNVTLMGSGMSSTTLKCNTGFYNTTGLGGGYPTVSTNAASNVKICDLTIDGNIGTIGAPANAQRTIGYHIHLKNTTGAVVERVAVRNRWTYAIVAEGSSNFLIQGCDVRVDTNGVTDQLDGIHVLDSFSGRVIGNHVDNKFNNNLDGDDALVVHTVNADCHDITFSGNEVRGGFHGCDFQFAGGNHLIYGVVVNGNMMWGGQRGVQVNWFIGPGGDIRDCSVTGNVVRDTVEPAFHVINAQGAPWKNFIVTGNSFIRSGSPFVSLDAAGTNNTVTNNVTG